MQSALLISEYFGGLLLVFGLIYLISELTDKFFEPFRHIEKNPYAYKECNEIITKTKKYRQAVC
jgi:hypothetical protein